MLERYGHEPDAQVQQRPRLRETQWAAQTTTPTPTWSPSWPRPAAKMEMVEVTITVDDVDELGTLGGRNCPTSPRCARTPWQPTRSRAAPWTPRPPGRWKALTPTHFTITGGVLTFSSAPDFEKPNGRRRRRLQHLHGHRHGLGRRRNGDDGSHHHGRKRGRARSAERTG